MTTPPTEATTDLTAVLAAHEIFYGAGEDPTDVNGAYCECGRWQNIEHREVDALASAHRAHLAEVLAPLIRAERAAALDEAASAVRTARRGGMTPDFDGHPVASYIEDWLTARAEAERRGDA